MLFALVKEPEYIHHQWIMVQWSIHWSLVSAIGQLPSFHQPEFHA